MRSKRSKQRDAERQIEAFNQGLSTLRVSESLDENVEIMKRLFVDVDIMKSKFVNKDGEPAYVLFYSDGVVDTAIINDNVLRPLMSEPMPTKGPELMKRLTLEIIQADECEVVEDYKKIVSSVTYGSTILFVDGCGQAAILNTKNFPTRAVSEPDSEKALTGPREGFTESVMQSVSMLRRRARTNDFKIRQMTFGEKTQTSVVICYFDSVVNRGALEELFRRLETVDIDGVLDSNYLTELIRDHRLSPFRTIGYTERPDVVVGRLLEGRVAILVDGSPIALTLPYLFIENFQSSEDYFLSFYYTSFSRVLRIVGFFMTIMVPGLYIAVVAFHQEMLPTPLLINIAAERQAVPLPAAFEAFVMLIVFDILRETGIRMPTNIGQALSIVGALVIGQAAVEARLVAAPMIIVVAFTGITNLLVPRLNAAISFYRFFTLLMASTFGFLGLTISLSLMVIHIFALSSFGQSMLPLEGDMSLQAVKDTAIRAPWWTMLTRPAGMTRNRTRMKRPGGRGNA